MRMGNPAPGLSSCSLSRPTDEVGYGPFPRMPYILFAAESRSFAVPSFHYDVGIPAMYESIAMYNSRWLKRAVKVT